MTAGPFDAWWLPGVDLAGAGAAAMARMDAGDLDVRYPAPGPGLVADAVGTLREAGRALRDRPVDGIIGALDAAAARLMDPADPLRAEAEDRLVAATGYSREMATLVLDRMAPHWRRPALETLVRAELGGAGPLDGFAELAEGRRARAYGPDLTFHVFAGNVPGVAVTSLVRSLLVKSPSLGKLASGQPVLPVLFARAIHSVDPELARALAVTYWPGGSPAAGEAEGRAVEAADLVVVYGGPAAEEAFRARVPDSQGRRLVVHGPRYSVGLVGREALADGELADEVAGAVAAFDQHGCVSPHALWVEDGEEGEEGGAAERFAAELAGALDRLEERLPRGRISAREAAAIQQERGAAELRGHTGGGRVLAGEGTLWTVVYDPDPAFRPSCLNRFIRVHPVASLEDVPALLAPTGARLQSVALACEAGRREALAHALAGAGATRVTTFGRLPWPPPGWHHDGQAPLRELLRWVDLER